MSTDYQDAPIDQTSAERLAAQGLELAVVDTADTTRFTTWLQAEARGFNSPRSTDEAIASQLTGLADRRSTGVWDATAADPDSPISTVSSWPAELTVPGETSVTAWAISAVTVAPTHRRRGIARAMIESELRTAAALGVPVAMLTVSEATIYSRYGFAPAAMMADWQIDSRRADWSGPAASGRLHFISLEQLSEQGLALVESVRLNTPGQMQFSGYLWERLAGQTGEWKDEAKNLRAVRYDDANGVPQGFVVYQLKAHERDFALHTLDVRYLVAVTDDAYAGLWRYIVEHDLVSTITASLRSTDEPVAWQISNYRAAHKTIESDHLWTRILDVPAALEARSYGAGGKIVFEVTDPLGFAEGRFLLDIYEDGTAVVDAFDEAVPDDAAAVSLTVNELSALYLGGVSAVTLVRAGRITELTEDAAIGIDAAFASQVAPWLSIWF